MLIDKVKTHKNKRMIDAMVRGNDLEYKEFITEEKETVVSRELISILNAKNDLSKYVTVVPVDRLQGSYPYVKLDSAELEDTTNIEINGDIADIGTTKVDYGSRTFRGALNISMELMQDAKDSGIEYGEVVGKQAKQIDINTKNREIISLFKTATPKAIKGIGELTTLVNTYFKSVYDIKMFVSSSMYDALDKADEIDYTKDYPRYKGKEVVKLDDTIIGKAQGDLVAYVGDAQEFLTLFDREDVTVKYITSKELFTRLRVSTRFDVEISNVEAGTYITYTL